MPGTTRRSVRDALLTDALLILAALWAGTLVGVSFIATPVKFTAPELGFAAALDVGRVTFALYSRVEWAFAVALVLIFAPSRFPKGATVTAGLLIGALAIQGFWLLPALNGRVAAVILGTPLPPSDHHMFYGVLEAGKLLCLAALVAVALRSRRLAGASPR